MTAKAEQPLAPLTRDLDRTKDVRHDLIVVGGGIYGACMLYEAAKRGMKAVLIESNDFGSGTSWNSMRLLHGGFRYLQSMDLPRYIESVRERRWFMRMFPNLIEPIDCLMPLYGDGLKHPKMFRLALEINKQLIRFEGRGAEEPILNNGKVLSASDVVQDWPQVPTAGLKGGGLWTDARMMSPERVILHLLRAATTMGSSALNYAKASELVVEHGKVVGVEVSDSISGDSFRVRSPLVINATGPNSRSFAANFSTERPELFMPLRSFNLVLDRPPLSESALAISSRQAHSRLYFATPFGQKMVIGTAQIPCPADDFDPMPSEAEVAQFLYEINEAAPGLDASMDQVSCVWSGQTPASYAGSDTVTNRSVVIDHAEYGGPRGLISVSGVKYTTARKLANQVISRLPVRPGTPHPDQPCSEDVRDIPGYGGDLPKSSNSSVLLEIIRDESVCNAEDLILRRTGLWQDPSSALAMLPQIALMLGLSDNEAARDRCRLEAVLDRLSRPWIDSGAGN